MKFENEKFKRRMKECFFTNATLAKAVGVSATAISNLRTGKAEPRAETLKKICTVLKCEPRDILED